MKKIHPQEKWFALVVALLLILQTALILFYGSKKSGFHEDEIYMFEFANNPTTYVRNTKNYYETWKNGDFYKNAIIPEGNNKFNYQHIYKNDEITMAQVYLSILHTISSLIPQIDLKWMGLIPNLAFSLISTILLYRIASILFDKKFGCIVVFAQVINIGMLTSAMLIRPYVLFTMLVLLFIYLHILAFHETCVQESFKIKILISLGVCTFLGISTQNYFFIICFLVCGMFAFFLLIIKKYKLLWEYCMAEFGSLICFLIAFRNFLQIFSTTLGQKTLQGITAKNVDLDKIKNAISTISQNVWNGWVLESLSIISVVAIMLFLNRYIFCLSLSHKPGKAILIQRKVEERGANRDIEWCIPYDSIIILIIAITIVAYVLIVAKIAIWQADRYYFCIYPLTLLVICSALYQLLRWIIKEKKHVILFLLCIICFVSVMSFINNDVNYLYLEFLDRKKVLDEYSEYPVVIMSKYPTKPERFIPEYIKHQYVYRCKNGSYSGIENAAEAVDLTGGFLLYVFDYEDKDESLFTKINENYFIDKYNLLDSRSGCRVFSVNCI